MRPLEYQKVILVLLNVNRERVSLLVVQNLRPALGCHLEQFGIDVLQIPVLVGFEIPSEHVLSLA